MATQGLSPSNDALEAGELSSIGINPTALLDTDNGTGQALAPPPRSSSREPPADRSGQPATRSSLTENVTNTYSEKSEDVSNSRKRDASRGSKRSAAQAHTSATDSAPPKAKKKGFLSFLACCGGSTPEMDEPDSPDSVQLAKSNSRTQPSRSRIPAQAQNQNVSVTDTTTDSKDVIDEKGTYEGASSMAAENGIALAPVPAVAEASSHDQKASQPYLNTSTGPQVNVQAPTPVTAEEEELISDRTPEQAQRDTDIEMTDAGPSIPLSSAEVAPVPEDEHEAVQSTSESTHRVDLPPPPPLAERVAQTSNAVAVAHGQDPSIAFSPEPSRKWLLPSISPAFKGRKCLVLDLDETLVHSSFKVSCRTFSACSMLTVLTDPPSG